MTGVVVWLLDRLLAVAAEPCGAGEHRLPFDDVDDDPQAAW